MTIGQLRQRISVYEDKGVRDPAGQVTPDWRISHRKLPAALVTRTTADALRGEQATSAVDATFVGRYCDLKVITTDMRIEWDGAMYEVKKTRDTDGLREWFELQCALVT